MDLRRITIFAFILLFILLLGSKYAFTGPEKPVTFHSPQREISKDLSQPQTVFYQTHVDHVTVTNQGYSHEEIKENYKRKFEELQSKTNDQLDDLVEQGLHDFKAYINGDHSDNDSLITLYQSYAAQGQKIEQQTEKDFQTIYKNLINELAQNGYPEDAAKEFKQIYEQQKEERKSQILKQAFSIIQE